MCLDVSSLSHCHSTPERRPLEKEAWTPSCFTASLMDPSSPFSSTLEKIATIWERVVIAIVQFIARCAHRLYAVTCSVTARKVSVTTTSLSSTTPSPSSPWDEVLEKADPGLKEQLMAIQLLSRSKQELNSADLGGRFPLFCLTLLDKEEKTVKPSSYLVEKQQLLGKILYLLDKNPTAVIKALEFNTNKKKLEEITGAFNDAVKEVKNRLSDHQNAHGKTGLQPKEIGEKTQRPVEIARMLLTETGILNVGIMELLKEIFLENTPSDQNYAINLSHTLTMLQQSSILRKKIAQIKKPSSETAPANEVIRVTLGLSAECPITDLHAKQTILTALLSHLRQGQAASCFAIYLPIELMSSSNLEKCVDDLAALIESSKLIRTINGKIVEFPFLLRTSSENVSYKFTINKEGQFSAGDAYLWEAPGIQAACLALQLDAKTTIQKILDEIFAQTKKEFKKLNTKELLRQLAKQAALQNENNPDPLFWHALFAFEAQTSNALLRVWENSIAGMAEGQTNSFIKSNIIDSTLDALNPESAPFFANDHATLTDAFAKELLSCFQEKIHLQYDPTISHGPDDMDNHSTEGAFVLYEKHEGLEITHWKRIDNSEAFQCFVINVLKSAEKRAQPSLQSPKKEQILNNILQKLKLYVGSSDFLFFIQANYRSKFPFQKEGLSSEKRLFITPWISALGHDAGYVLQVYMEMQKPPKTHKFVTENSEHLLIAMIDYLHHIPSNSPIQIPLRIAGFHAFSFMPKHPTLTKAITSSLPSNEWVQSHLVLPGTQIADTPIDQSMQQKMIQFVAEKLLSPSYLPEFLSQLQTLPPSLSIKEFRTSLLNIIYLLKPFLKKHPKSVSQKIDTYLISCLPDHLKKALEITTVHVADSNWNIGIHDLHLGFLVNPGTGKIELWKISDDGSYLKALNQKQWVINREWELYPPHAN